VARHSRTARSNNPRDVGTLTADSGNRLNGPLTGIDIPTLRDGLGDLAPYRIIGSAATIADAIRAHAGIALNETELSQLAEYVAQIGNQEGLRTVPPPVAGTGLVGAYFNNLTLTGAPVLTRTEAVNFSWSTRSPGT
jgi:hypothetical protein